MATTAGNLVTESSAGRAEARASTARATAIDRWAGAAGLAFLVSVVVQNVLRTAVAPGADAAAADLRSFLVDDIGLVRVLDALVAVNVVFLVLFVAAVYRRTASGAGATWARVGLLGATGVISFFLLTVAVEAAMAARRADASDEILETLWSLHNAVFAFAMLALAVALLGLALASVAEGLVPRAFLVIGPVGALLMVGTAAATVPVAEGSAVVGVGMVGFLGWLAYLAFAGIGLIRSAP